MGDETIRGVLDTNIIILRGAIPADELPAEMAISAVTLAELSAGVNSVPGDSPDAVRERARRVAILQRTEREFDPLPFDAAAARMYGLLTAGLLSIGRTPRRRVADLMIASIAASQGLPLYTTNPSDYEGIGEYVQVVPVTRPHV
ncbi:MAG: type II toxin-antitoxin system VapC family toxin [Propionibacteriaceae bacterium]|jgi:predicted nucleic acid-binding protein|nr:type II toxin-antitoxin system VapC family toxin [Propionibacteriaceae bacterium]